MKYILYQVTLSFFVIVSLVHDRYKRSRCDHVEKTFYTPQKFSFTFYKVKTYICRLAKRTSGTLVFNGLSIKTWLVLLHALG